MLTRFSWSRKSNLMTDQNMSNLPLSCSTPLMKTKPSYGAFVFWTRQHFMWMDVLIDTTATFGEHSSRMRFTSMFKVHQKWTSGVGFCTIVLLVPSLVRAPVLGLSLTIYLNSTCFHSLKPSNKKLQIGLFLWKTEFLHISVAGVLNKRFPDAWIGRGGQIPWTSRSPDLSPPDFFPVGYIKNIVYAEKVRNIQHLQERITSTIGTVTRDIIQKTWHEIEFRLESPELQTVHILKCTKVSLNL